MRILIADDDPIACAALAAELGRLGHNCFVTDSGEMAWEVYATGDVRVVISDWRMPGLDGLALCRRIRERRGEYAYFILLTQVEDNLDNQKLAIEAGVDDFLHKPVDRHELWMRLHVAERILSFTRQVKQLEEILPICGYCKKIRDDHNYWNQIEKYFRDRTGAEFTHSICPDCMARHVQPELDRLGVARAKPRVDRVD